MMGSKQSPSKEELFALLQQERQRAEPAEAADTLYIKCIKFLTLRTIIC